MQNNNYRRPEFPVGGYLRGGGNLFKLHFYKFTLRSNQRILNQGKNTQFINLKLPKNNNLEQKKKVTKNLFSEISSNLHLKKI